MSPKPRQDAPRFQTQQECRIASDGGKGGVVSLIECLPILAVVIYIGVRFFSRRSENN